VTPVARSLAAPARRIPRLIRSGGIPLTDQAAISFSNFTTSVIVARSVDVQGFGVFTLALTLLFAANALQGSLVTGPLAVLIAGRDPEGRRRYITSIAGIQVVLIAVLAGLPLLVAAFADAETARVAVAVAVVALGWQTQEFARRVLYVEDRFAGALANDLLSYGGQVVACLALAAAGALTTVTALEAIGLTSLLAGFLGLWAVRHSLGGRPSTTDVGLTLRHGVWLAAGEVAQFATARLPAFLLAALVAVTASGVLGAALIVLNPLNVVLFSMWTVLPMRLARVRAEQGEEAASRLLRRIHILTTPPVIAFCIAAAIMGEFLLDLLYENRYLGYGWVVALIALFSILRFHSGLVMAGLWSKRLSRSIFIGQMVGAIVAVGAGVALVASLGLAGAVLAMIAATATSTIVWWLLYLRGGVHGEAMLATVETGPAAVSPA